MNSPALKISAPSPQPALELIALAQLSPDTARKRLRALLLTNPNYFEKIPPSSFSAVLNIQQDTTYESISSLLYDSEIDRLSAAIDVKQPSGYSSEILVRGSEEFVRFYLSYDGGSKWHDLGIGSVTVVDTNRPGTCQCEVALNGLSENELIPDGVKPKIRAILSWSTPPPMGEPGWKPVWGHVAESDVYLEAPLVLERNRSIAAKQREQFDASPDMRFAYRPMDFTSARSQGHLSMCALHSTKTDPHHRFLAFALARAAGYCALNSSENPNTGKSYRAQGTLPVPSLPVDMTACIS
ncbi:hypothetical protein P8935_09800 [Telmatobacter sp. DSM 110680]|uniref:Uncharacterized protein n=1 Tax=Telmatobacter sp. DSM 110680 TaxID=3036704 RepID=A0AAU7DQR9_9BACT